MTIDLVTWKSLHIKHDAWVYHIHILKWLITGLLHQRPYIVLCGRYWRPYFLGHGKLSAWLQLEVRGLLALWYTVLRLRVVFVFLFVTCLIRDRPFNFWGGGGGDLLLEGNFFSGIVMCKIIFPTQTPCTIFFATLFRSIFFSIIYYAMRYNIWFIQ